MDTPLLLKIEQAKVNYLGKLAFDSLNFSWLQGQHWAILGDSGLRLSAFIETLLGTTAVIQGKLSRPFAEEYSRAQQALGAVHSYKDLIASVSQHYPIRNKANQQNFYYQQRFNSLDVQETVSVLEYLKAHQVAHQGPWDIEKVTSLLRLEHLLSSSIVELSNGETRRLALALGLLRQPRLFLMDQPHTGLDAQSRATFGDFLAAIIAQGVHVLMTTTSDEIPEQITHIARIQEGMSLTGWSRADYPHFEKKPLPLPWNVDQLKELLPQDKASLETLVELNAVCIGYGTTTILKDINWKIRAGERWRLSGKNGSGKSTLISILIGENPQAYSQDFSLFGRKRGTGESIWEVKKPIGFVAPELSRFFPRNQTLLKVILSGLMDTMGLFKKVSLAQEALALEWIRTFHLEDYQDVYFHQLPLEAKRWALLARALIKKPSLLILDEASQGLDEKQRIVFRDTLQWILEHCELTVIYVSHYEEDLPPAVNKLFELP